MPYLKKKYPSAVKETENMLRTEPSPGTVKLTQVETNIGTTRYDLQSNQSVQNRLYMFPDGTLGGIWTRGISDAAFPDRGTGYNYFDGTSWAAEPSARIEPLRTGWPSYAPLGASGEIVVSHTDIAGLSVDKRTDKNTGSWTHSILAGPAGAVDISWPRMVTSGADHNKVHVIACTYVAYQGQTQALLYYRSQDGGATWDKQHVILPGLGSTDYNTIGGDSYAFANPKGDTLAFVVGDNWMDLALMKSTDGGENWTKTVVFQHPYPHFEETTTLVTDTPTVVDGSLAVALDNNGKAHVFFGLMKVLNDDLTDGQTSYFPYTDGLGYWNEDMPMMTNLDIDALDAQGQLVGFTQDVNGNDTILEFDGVATYYLSVTSMPNVSIDHNGNIFVLMSSIVEGLSSGTQNYRHIYGRMSLDGGANWSDFLDLQKSIVHNFHECVYPTVSPTSNNNLDLIYQQDDEPGLAVRGDADPYGDNTIVHVSIPKTDFGVGIRELEQMGFTFEQAFPNPCTDFSVVKAQLQKTGSLKLELRDMTGRLLFESPEKYQGPGEYSFRMDVKDLTPGMYFYTLTVSGKSISDKLIVR